MILHGSHIFSHIVLRDLFGSLLLLLPSVRLFGNCPETQ